MINRGYGALPEFKAINEAAYWDYQRLRVYVRTSKVVKKAARRKVAPTKSHVISGIVSHEPPTSCPNCGGTDLLPRKGGRGHTLVRDIKLLQHGVKAWVTRHTSAWCSCPRCQHVVGPKLEHPFSLHKYGPTLRAYAVDQLIRLNIPGATIASSLSSLFHFDLNGEHLSGWKAAFAELYSDAITELTAKIRKGPLVHADETPARMVGKSAVVWVLASMEEVVFLYADSREGDMVHEVLKGFQGVLVSDFFAVYDDFTCPQQKCLIHLIRDFNDDLHKFPFDSELREIATRFTGVLKPIVDTIDQRGLKARFLGKHRPRVERFLKWVTTQDFESESGQKYGQRFRKNREKLFTFMSHDGIPWNNNNAENAIRAFAALRERVGAHCTEKSLRHYLILLSLSETCKRRGLSFLDFLLSGSRSLETFAAESRPKQRASRGETASAKNTARPARHPVEHESDLLIKPADKERPSDRGTPVVVAEVPSPWEKFRASAIDQIARSSWKTLKLDRFENVPFGGAVLALPALIESGLFEQTLTLFPTWIDRGFVEMAMFMISTMVLSEPANLESLQRVSPANWREILCGSKLPDTDSLVDLIGLIRKNPSAVAGWQGSMADKWIFSRRRLKAILVGKGYQRVLLEEPGITSSVDRARDSLLAHGWVEPWFRFFNGANMLLIMDRSSEGILSALKNWILPQLRLVAPDLIGKPVGNATNSPRVTVVLARGGEEPQLLRKLQKHGFHAFSYQLSTEALCLNATVCEQEVEVQPGHSEAVQTAERELSLPGGPPLRQMLCVLRNGSARVSIICSDPELDLRRVGGRMVLELTASHFLDRLEKSQCVLGSKNTPELADIPARRNANAGFDAFLGASVLMASRAEGIIEQILREKLPQPSNSPVVLRDLLRTRVDLVPIPGVNIMKVLVWNGGGNGEQAAVAELCSQLTATETAFPGTNLRLVYEPARQPSENPHRRTSIAR